jgi:dTDP-L-rhamnose 4-epimerase
MAVSSVLIIGGTGLIGSHLCGRLVERGLTVKVLGRSSRFAVPDAVPQDANEKVEIVAADPGDPEILEELVRGADAIFHKTVSAGMFGAVECARDYVGANVASTATLVDVLKSAGSRVKKVILGSSISVYGEGNYNCQRCGIVRPELRTVNHPLSHPIEWNPPCPNCGGAVQPVVTAETAERRGESIYSVTKKAQEDLLAGVCRQLNIPLTVLRYSAVLGSGQSWHNPFTRMLELLATGKTPVLHEDGLQTRNFIFIEDVVEANMHVLNHQDAPVDYFNVSAMHLPLIDFVSVLSRSMSDSLSSQAIEPEVDGRLVSGDVRHCRVDCARLTEKLGFKPSRQLNEGVQSLTDWFVRFKGITSRKTAG